MVKMRKCHRRTKIRHFIFTSQTMLKTKFSAMDEDQQRRRFYIVHSYLEANHLSEIIHTTHASFEANLLVGVVSLAPIFETLTRETILITDTMDHQDSKWKLSVFTVMSHCYTTPTSIASNYAGRRRCCTRRIYKPFGVTGPWAECNPCFIPWNGTEYGGGEVEGLLKTVWKPPTTTACNCDTQMIDNVNSIKML